jgi:predicted nucleotidyltransferase
MSDTNRFSGDGQFDRKLNLLLGEVKTGLEQIYGDQLKGVYLFGSYARGEQDAESDVDILIILSDYDRYGPEIDRTGELISTLSLEYDLTLSRVFIREADWQNLQTPLLRNAREEAIPV